MSDSQSPRIQTEVQQESITDFLDGINLNIEDKDLSGILEKYLESSDNYYKYKKKINEKREKNKDYLMGKQWDEGELQTYNARYMDNLIYEGESLIKPISFSKLPDVSLTSGSNDERAKQDAKDLGRFFTDETKKRSEKQTLELAFKHIPVDYIGVIKARWNPELGKNGDYEFIHKLSKNMHYDPNATSLDTSKHRFLGEDSFISVKEIIMMFPKKQDEILKACSITKVQAKDEKRLATTQKLEEWWFTWYEKEGDKFKKIEGVAWKLKKIILVKMKDRNWDWEGEERLFTYDFEKMMNQPVKNEKLQDALLHSIPTGVMPNQPNTDNPLSVNMQNFKTQKNFHNHFKSPKKPYILIAYDRWGEMVLDETSRIEQVLTLQDNVNIRGRQITEIGRASCRERV